MDRFPSPSDCIGGARVGLWLHRLAAEYRSGALPSDRFDLAQTLFREAVLGDHFLEYWNLVVAWAGQGAMSEAQWYTAIREIKAFITRHDRAPQQRKVAERQLGNWLMNRRAELKAGKLSVERCALANSENNRL